MQNLSAHAGRLTEGMRRDLERLRAELPEPELQLLALLMLGLERERIVAISYADEALAERLAATRLSPRVRAELARALARVWRDEEMHARYLQGVLLRQRALGTRVRAALQNASGMVGGWVAAVEQLRDRSPLRHAAAGAAAALGALAGRIPPEARDGLRYGPLREYAAFNVDAELSAVAGYDRMLEIVAELDATGTRALLLPPGFDRELAQARREELEHAALFLAVAEALTDEDALAEGSDEERFVAEIRSAVSAGERVSQSVSGATVVAVRRRGACKRAALREALAASGFGEMMAERALAGHRSGPLRVAVKVDFMLGYSREDPSTIVDPELVEELARAAREAGGGSVVVVESRNLYDHFYAGRSVAEVAAYFGYRSDAYEVVDLSLEQERHEFRRGMALGSVGRSWRDADVRISFAKLKTHPTEQFALTLWNLANVIEQRGELLFHDRHADIGPAIMELLEAFPVHFGVVDGCDSAADGILGAIACRTPKRPGLVYAGRSLFAIDAVAARHMGVPEARASSIYQEATYWFDEALAAAVIDGEDAKIENWRPARSGLRGRLLGAMARRVYAMASGRGLLFVPRMDTAAFPPLERRLGVELARRAVRGLLGT